MIKIALAVLLTVVDVAPANAADWYAGFNAGPAKYNIPNTIYSPTAIGIFGGYPINPILAVEAELVELGNVNSSRASVMGVSALLFYPDEEPFTLYAKLSYTSSEWRVSNQVQYNSSITHGLGCQYEATPKVKIRFGWDRYMIGNRVAINVDVLSVAGIFRF